MPAAIALGVALVATVLLAVGGFDAGAAVRALWSGSFGSWYALTSATLVRTIPLLVTGVAVAVAFKGGILNVGAEGQLLVGAAAAASVALAWPTGGVATLAIALAAGMLAGAAWAGIAAMLRARFAVLEVISTLMLNFLAAYGVAWLVRGPLQESTHVYPQTETLAEAVRLPRVPGAGRLHAGIVVAVALAALGGWAMRRTAAGFRVRAVGESPSAARSAGRIDATRTTTAAFATSGALAGLAGAIEVHGVTFALYENLSPGYGFTAIAVALLAGLDPWRVPLTALLFGALEAGGSAMQRDAGVPATLVSVVEALIILGVLAAAAWRARRAESAR